VRSPANSLLFWVAGRTAKKGCVTCVPVAANLDRIFEPQKDIISVLESSQLIVDSILEHLPKIGGGNVCIAHPLK
jgi:hypothetical protein